MKAQKEKTTAAICHIIAVAKKRVVKCSLCGDKPFIYGFLEIGYNFTGYALCETCLQRANHMELIACLFASGELFDPSSEH